MKQFVVSAALAALATSAASAQQAVQWRIEDGGNGHWYEARSVGVPISWHQASVAANSSGGYLATVTSESEYSFVRELAGYPGAWSGRSGPWLGGYQDRQSPSYAEPAGGWRWVTNEAWFPRWGVGEPNNTGGVEDYLHFIGETCSNPIPTRHLNDFAGNAPFNSCTPIPAGYIIEWSADCNNDGIVDYGQILSSQLADANNNGVPDICEVDPCPADTNGNGVVNHVDLAAVLSSWGTDGQSEGDADTNNDGIVDGLDLTCVLGGWGPCITTPVWATVIEFAPDPAVVTNPTLRTAISATGLPWRVRDTATQIEMVLIPPGTFNMGCSPSNQHGCTPAESPVHTVTLTNAFYMGRYEVTQAQWAARMGSNPSWFQSASAQVAASQVPNRPVEQVSWDMVQGFLSATGMRLPTEAEWEYAYRAATTTAFHSMPGYPNGTNDDGLLGGIAWFRSNANDQTRPVGQKAGNGFGLHDMAGNVLEWVNDWFSSSYYATSPSINPTGPSTGTSRVLRSGSWYSFTATSCRSSDRFSLSPSHVFSDLGFRVARNP